MEASYLQCSRCLWTDGATLSTLSDRSLSHLLRIRPDRWLAHAMLAVQKEMPLHSPSPCVIAGCFAIGYCSDCGKRRCWPSLPEHS